MFRWAVDGDLRFNELAGWALAALLPLAYVACWPLVWLPWFFYVSYFVYRQYVAVGWVEAEGKAVYITGCDSGFGLGLALDLEKRGFTVFAGCLKPLEALELKDRAATSGGRLRILDLNVCDQKKVNACAKEIAEYCREKGLWALYNNAGFATAGEIEWFPLDDYQKQFDCNLWGTVRVTKSVLPLIRLAKGRIVTVTSGIARSVNPGRSAYSMSKGALEGFMDCLRYETAKFGVTCCTINPGNLSGATNVFYGMAERIDSIYARLDDDVRRDYGSEYLEAFRRGVVGYKSSGSTVSIQPVINDIVHAVASKEPRVRYKPAQISWIFWWCFYNVVPEEISDFYVIRWYLRNLPQPASVIKN